MLLYVRGWGRIMFYSGAQPAVSEHSSSEAGFVYFLLLAARLPTHSLTGKAPVTSKSSTITWKLCDDDKHTVSVK